jgi:TonB family protein
MRTLYLQILLSAAANLSLASGVAAVVPLQPTGKWVVHFDDAQCLAQRNYGTTEKPLYLLLKQPPVGDVLQLSILRAAQFGSTRDLEGTLEFAGSPQQKVSILKFTPKKGKLGVLMMNLKLEQFASARTSSAVTIQPGAGEGPGVTLALVQLGSLMDVMNSCVADLRKVWNVDRSAAEAGAERNDSQGALRGLFTADDFPSQALERMSSGTVKIALLVNEAGKVADCSVIETSGEAVLDAQTCIVVRARAKFAPMIASDGKPAKQAFIQGIRWQVE